MLGARTIRVTHSFSTYVSLAEALRCQCWTADGPMLRACAEHGRMRSVADFPALQLGDHT